MSASKSKSGGGSPTSSPSKPRKMKSKPKAKSKPKSKSKSKSHPKPKEGALEKPTQPLDEPLDGVSEDRQPVTVSDTLVASITALDSYFRRKIELIPAELYVAKESTEEDDDAWKSRKGFVKNKKGVAPKQAVKESSKKAKRLKLQQPISSAESTSTSDAIQSHNSSQPSFTLNSTQPPARNLKELSERLQKKLEVMRQKRGGKQDSKSTKSKNKTEKRMKKRQRKNTEEQPSEAEGENEGESQVSESKSEKRKWKRNRKQHQKLSKLDDSELKEQQSKLNSKLAASMKSNTIPTPSKPTITPKTKTPKQKSKTKTTSESDAISFGMLKVGSKVVVGDGEVGEAGVGKKVGGKRNLLNVKKMLAKAEKNRARIAELKQSKDETMRAQGDAEKWAQMEARAVGSVDPKESDPKMLKKRVKRLEKAKAKRAEKWKERSQQTKLAMKEKQDKRRQNIKAQQEKKTENRLKRKGIVVEQNTTASAAAKPKDGKDGGRMKRRRPGFEGKHGGFLNAKKKQKTSNSRSNFAPRAADKFQAKEGNGSFQPWRDKSKGKGVKTKRKNK